MFNCFNFTSFCKYVPREIKLLLDNATKVIFLGFNSSKILPNSAVRGIKFFFHHGHELVVP